MNSDADYSYAEPAPVYTSSSSSLQLPIALLASTLAVVMLGQTVGAFNQKSALKAGIVKLEKAEKSLADTIEKRKPLVAQSGELKAKLNAMIMDLLILGKTDEDAKAIIAKYNIQQNLPPGSGDAAEPKASEPK